MKPEVRQYILDHRERYTREAIETHLLRAGYTQAEIDASWPSIDQKLPTPAEDRAFWRAFTFSVVGMYGITFLVYAASFYISSDDGYEFIALIISGIFLIVLLVVAMSSVAQVRQNRRAARGAASGLLTALVIPFVLLIIVAGLCTALTGAPFTSRGM